MSKKSLDYRTQRVDRAQARRLIVNIVKKHRQNISISKHAEEQMAARDLTVVDVFNVLASPDSKVKRDGELERWTYRYQYGTKKITVVVAFNAKADGLTVVTAWRD